MVERFSVSCRNQFERFEYTTWLVPDGMKMGEYSFEVGHQCDRILEYVVVDTLEDEVERFFVAFEGEQVCVVDMTVP